MWPRDFCGFVRVSSNYTVWWSDAGKICTQIHTLGAFYDGNRTDGRHYRFALPQTFWQIFDFLLLFATRDSQISLTPSLTFGETLNPFLKCVLNGLLTWCSCNPRFFVFFCMEMLHKKTLIRWRSCHSNKFCRMKNWNEKEKEQKCKRKRRWNCVFYLNCFQLIFFCFFFTRVSSKKPNWSKSKRKTVSAIKVNVTLMISRLFTDKLASTLFMLRQQINSI